MQPHSQWPLTGFVPGLRVDILSGQHLHDYSLSHRVVYLAVVLVKNPVCFIRQFWFVIAGLRNYHWTLVLLFDLLLL
jgi:hypothetical protein